MTLLIYISSRDKMTLSLGLKLFQEDRLCPIGADEWLYIATMTLPIVIMFFFAQRRFIQALPLQV